MRIVCVGQGALRWKSVEIENNGSVLGKKERPGARLNKELSQFRKHLTVIEEGVSPWRTFELLRYLIILSN